MKRYKKTEIVIELDIESIGFNGISVAKSEGKVYFIKCGVPGDKVLACITKNYKTHFEGIIKKLLISSPYRIKPFCHYFGECGGCSWQNLDYSQQLFWKKQHIIDSYQRLGNISNHSNLITYYNTIPAQKTTSYRNKMDFSFSYNRWFIVPKNIDNFTDYDVTVENENSDINLKYVAENNRNFALGLHVPANFSKVIDIKKCSIQNKVWNEIIDTVRKKAIELMIQPYNARNFSGFLKGLTLRYSLQDNETMIILTTNIFDENHFNDKLFIDWYRFELCNLFPNIVSVVHAENSTNSVNIGEIKFIEGKQYLIEKILDVNFQISPFSFFQTNSYQLQTFIQLIIDVAKIETNDVIWDLYCGTGSITLPIAKRCKEIYGVELNATAITDANRNANLNKINNVYFFAEDLHSKKSKILDNLPIPNVIIVDPPRSGLHPNVIKSILHHKPQKLIYVSCNPTTQARDLQELTLFYDLLNVYSIDMFPHTYHIEVVAELRLKNKLDN